MTSTRVPPVRPDGPARTARPAMAPPPSARDRGTRLLAALFLAPTVAGIVVFTVVPIAGSVVLSLFHWNVIDPPRFAGAANYGEVFGDATVLVSFRNTLVFMVLAVALQLLVALVLALAVNGRMPVWLRSVFRSAFFFPLVLSAASVSVVMKYLFNQDFGWSTGCWAWSGSRPCRG